MATLSRQSSRRPLLQADETSSLTSFPDPSSTTPSQEHEVGNQALYSLLSGDGPTMFDENMPEMATDPQTLSAAANNELHAIVDHHGPVSLVRRLATLLAERDAHITALKRLAEDYKIPSDRIDDAASRAKQGEQRRLALITAADEDLMQSGPSDSSDSNTLPRSLTTTTAGGTVKGITRLFGGGTMKRAKAYVSKKCKKYLKPVYTNSSRRSTPSSSRSTSRAPLTRRERPQSIDAQSFASVQTAQSAESASWANLFGSGNSIRRDSRPPKEPVELVTRHDKDQLPPTLSNRPDDPQEAAWNRYLQKLMKSRAENGEHDQSGALIGASQFGQEGAVGKQKMKLLVQLLVEGIPMLLRHNIWMELSNTEAMVEPGAYEHYLNTRDEEDATEIEAILKDVPRTLTSKYDFYAGKGFKRLKEVLVAFVGKYEGLGYTQGLNTIAGYLLLAIPEDEHAFWMLCNMVDNYFPEGYFSRETSMTGPLADNIVLRSYVKELMPQLSKHLDELQISADHTVPLSWLFTAFSNVLPEDVLMRVWDVWLCMPEQKTFLFNVALAILKQNASGLMACENEGEYWSYLDNSCIVSGDKEWVSDLIKQAVKLRPRLENIDERRALEFKLLRKKRDSTEALYSPDE